MRLFALYDCGHMLVVKSNSKLLILLLTHMLLLCTHKIGTHSATPSHAYQVIRLPREFASLAGKTAEIYQTGQDGKFTFVISVGKSVDKLCANEGRSQVEERLAALEIEISELKSLLLLNEGASLHENQKRWARPDSNRRPPPCEGSSDLVRAPIVSRPQNQLDRSPFLEQQALTELELPFKLDELTDYAERRKCGLTHYSVDWIDRSQQALWKTTKGKVSKRTIDRLRIFVLKKYHSEWSHVKVLGFAKAFLKFLTKTRLDTRYYAFEVFLERPRAIKPRQITSRIIVKEDIENVLACIKNAKDAGLISNERALQYASFTLLASYTGQRSVSTISRLRVGQFREALQMRKPTLLVEADQDKVRYAHWVPLIPPLIEALVPLFDGRGDNELMFDYHSYAMWIKRQRIPLTRLKTHFVLGDMRKWCIQYGCDTLEWELSNRSHILSHGLSNIEDKHYRHPLPEQIYDVYCRYWRDVEF